MLIVHGHLGKILITVMRVLQILLGMVYYGLMEGDKNIYVDSLFFLPPVILCRNCCKTLSRRKLSKPEDQASNIRNPAGCLLHKTVRASIHSSISSSWGFFFAKCVSRILRPFPRPSKSSFRKKTRWGLF